MAGARIILLTLLCTLSSKFATSSGIFDQILDDVSPCMDVCENTYPLHTYPKAENLYACKRGCRMFSIMDFVLEQPEDYNSTYKHCSAACVEAYVSASNRYACNLGCKNEVPFAKKKIHDVIDMPPRIHFLEPLMMVRHFCNNFWDSARSYTSWSWSVYAENDNGKIYMFQSEPEIFTSVPLGERSYAGSDKTLRDMETNLQALRGDEATMYPDSDGNSDWLSCVSRKSGLPRWVLSATILLSSVALLWLCCATTVTAPDQKVPKQKLSIYGDLEYLNDSKEKYPYPVYIKPAAPHEGDGDAEPLPLKINICNGESQI